jgi:hypothetical protein
MLFAFCHRIRGYRAHRAPGIPCALLIEGGMLLAKLAHARRDREFVSANGGCLKIESVAPQAAREGPNSHPDVEHVRQLCERQRRADDGGDQRHQDAVAAALAAHLACDPLQHFRIDIDRLRGRPAFD